MSWRRVAVIYTVLAALAVWVFALDGAPPVADQPSNEPPPPAASILETDAAAVTTLTLRKDGKLVRANRTDDRWATADPREATVPPDLYEAMVATLTAGQAAEELGHESETALATYGLATPAATLEVALRGTSQPITVYIGDQNPTRTAVYARRNDRPTIYLVGMNLRYYIDLVFEAATPG